MKAETNLISTKNVSRWARKSIAHPFVAATSALLLSVGAWAQAPCSFPELSAFVPAGTSISEGFGYDIAFESGYAFVVSRGKSAFGGGPSDNLAYVFAQNEAGTPLDPTDDTWTEIATLNPDPGAIPSPTKEGYRIVARGDTVAVLVASGLVYVFEKPGLGWSGSILPSAELDTGSIGGEGLGMDNDAIAASGSGGVVVFVKPGGGWVDSAVPDANLVNPGLAGYGSHLDMLGDVVVVGAQGDASGRGSALVYEKPHGGWTGSVTHVAKLAPGDTSEDIVFGSEFSIDGDWIAISARGGPLGSGQDSGPVYLFERPSGGWAGDPLYESARLKPSDSTYDKKFGEFVDLQGNLVLVGSKDEKAYLFCRPASGWMGDISEVAMLIPSDNATGDCFGREGQLAGDICLVGAPDEPHSPDEPGTVYTFDLRAQITIEQNPVGTTVCEGNAAQLDVVASSGLPLSYQWYRDAGVLLAGEIGPTLSFAAPTLADADDYYVVIDNGSCEKTSASAGLTVLIRPPAPTAVMATPSMICSDEPVSLSASVPGTEEVWWYSVGCGVQFVGQGNPLVVQPTQTTAYYARSYDSGTGCFSLACGSVVVDVDPSPVPATPLLDSDDDDDVICPSTPVLLSVTNPEAGVHYDWYSGSCGGAVLHTGSTYAVNPTETTSYFARARSSAGCLSPSCGMLEIVVQDQPPSASISPSYLEYCAGDTILLTATVSAGDYQWYRNGIPLSGKTQPTLRITRAASSHAGDYTMTVTDACGVVETSAPTTLIEAYPRIQSAVPATLPTSGGTVVFHGQFLTPATQLAFRTPNGKVQPAIVSYNPPMDDQITVTFDPIPPGCDCALTSAIPVAASFDNGCGMRDLADFGLSFDFDIVRVDVAPADDLQNTIDTAAAGSCIVLTDGDPAQELSYDGPFHITGKSALTLTSDSPLSPDNRKLNGDYLQVGSPPSAAALILDGVGEDVCVSYLNLRLGNSGVEIRNLSSPRLIGCLLDDNHASPGFAGGITVHGGSDPLVAHCEVRACETEGSGGALRIDGATGLYLYNVFTGNFAGMEGGGVFLHDIQEGLVLADNQIFQNSASGGPGGGVFWSALTSDPAGLLVRNVIGYNDANGSGGGIYLDATVFPEIIANRIHDNATGGESGLGGGVLIESGNLSPVRICENEIFRNMAQVGGGLALLSKCEAVVERNLIYCNQAVATGMPPPPGEEAKAAYAAGVLIVDADVELLHNTIYGNTGFDIGESLDPPVGDPRMLESNNDQGGGITYEVPGATSDFVDNLIVANEGFEFFVETFWPGFGILDYNWLFDGSDLVWSSFSIPGPNNTPSSTLSAGLDPLFVNPGCNPSQAWDELGLQAGSLAIGMASDLEDVGAVLHGGFRPGSCLNPASGDCNANGIPDWADILAGTSADANLDGNPDECSLPPPTIGVQGEQEPISAPSR